MTDQRSRLRPRARLMQHLGADLIPNDRVALFELIKNSYDADASMAILRFRDLGTDHAVIELWDDGHGMDESTVQSNWLEIANPNRKKNPRSESGSRRVLGAKGLGRFAVARLAETTELTTRRAGSPEVFLKVSWDDFNDDELFLEDVEIGWGTRDDPEIFDHGGPASLLYNATLAALDQGNNDEAKDGPESDTDIDNATAVDVLHGTLLTLSPARSPWTAEDISELSASLSRLTPPPPPTELGVSVVPDFQIALDRDDGAGPMLVGPSPTIAKPAYRLLGRIDSAGKVTLQFTTTHEGGDAEIEVLLPNAPGCGPLAVDLRLWDLESEALRDLMRAEGGIKTIREVRELIRSASGIALYRDGFRVQPYGDRDVDWLGLDARRVNNPTMRVSNNQIVGFVFTSADQNPALRDQANRQGLIENSALASLRDVIVAMLKLLEERRYELRRRDAPTQSERERVGGIFAAFSLAGLRETVTAAYPNDARLHRAVEQAESDLERGVEGVQEVVSRFSRLSTLGSLVDVMLHEGNTAIASVNFITAELEILAEEAESDLEARLRAFIERLQLQIETLSHLFRNLEPLSGRRRGRPKKVDMITVLEQAVAVLEGELRSAGVVVEIVGKPRTVTVDIADVMQIVINLVRNAVYWTSTKHGPGDRKIRISMLEGVAEITIEVSDNGPGVPENRAASIFDAYYTTRENGVGLGLNIAGSIAADFYDGELALVDDGPLPGATFHVTLRRRLG